MKRGPYNKDNSKAWQNCLAKLNQYQTMPVSYWTEYELLGYWCSLTRMPFNQENCEPRRHIQLRKMRLIVAQLTDDKFKRARMPQTYNAEQVKQFLDWCWETMQKTNRPCRTSLTYIIGSGCRWIKNFKQDNSIINSESERPFNPAELDI